MKPNELKELLKKKQGLVIDVREPSEYEKSKEKVPGAQNIPMGKIFLMHSLRELPKTKKIVVMCLYGSRSKIVAKELKKKGYDIERLDGGIKGWINYNNS